MQLKCLLFSGNLFEDMDIDFLNVKDMGLNFRSIPVSLWNRNSEKPIRARVRQSVLLKKDASTGEEDSVVPLMDFPTPEPWPALVPKFQPALFKQFYETLQAEDGGGGMVEVPKSGC